MAENFPGHLRGDGGPVHRGEEGDAELHLPRPLHRHVRNHGGIWCQAMGCLMFHHTLIPIQNPIPESSRSLSIFFSGQHSREDVGESADEDCAHHQGEPPGT